MHWKIYKNNPEVWEDMLTACEKAKKSIDLEQFIFVSDEIGRRFIDICTKKASEGVRVRLLWDGAGSFTLIGNFLISVLSRRGVQVSFFNTFIPRTLHSHKWWFFRNHRRSLVVDEEIAFTGSICIWEKTKKWRDTSVFLTGNIVKEISKNFEIMWDRSNGVKVNWGKKDNTTDFKYVINAPLSNKRFMHDELISAIRHAKKFVYLATPYFVPDRTLYRVLRLAKRRGVDVRIIIPKKSNHKIVDMGAMTFFNKALKSKIKIYRHTSDENSFIHAKYGVIDGDWSTIGTMNLDNVSLLYNFEANVVSTNLDFCAEIESMFVKDIAQSEELTLEEWEKRGFLSRFLESFVRFIRKFL